MIMVFGGLFNIVVVVDGEKSTYYIHGLYRYNTRAAYTHV